MFQIVLQAGEGSYFSESEYTMDDWQTRLWGKENYDRLASIKQVWDPTHIFGCRHCIGDGLEPQVSISPTFLEQLFSYAIVFFEALLWLLFVLALLAKAGTAHSSINSEGAYHLQTNSCYINWDIAIFEISKNFSLEAD